MEFQALDGESRNKLLDQQVLGRAIGSMPVPYATTAREEPRSALGEMIGQDHETVKQLAGGVLGALMVRGRRVDDTALMGDLADHLLRLLLW